MQRTLIVLISVGLLGALPSFGQVDINRLHSDFRAAAIADDFAKMRSLIEGKEFEVVVATYMIGESRYAQAKSAGQAGATAMREEMIFLEQFATLNKLYGTRQGFLNERLAWFRALDDAKIKAFDELFNGYAKSTNAYFAANNRGTEDLINVAMKEIEVYRKHAVVVADVWHRGNCERLSALLLARIPDWFGVAYSSMTGISLSNEAARNGLPQTKAAMERWNLSTSLDNAQKRGQVKREFVNIGLPVEEARAEYDRKLKEAVTGPVGDGDGGGSGGSGGGSAAANAGFSEMPPAPNVHDEGVEMSWVEDDGLKLSRVKKRNFPTHWFYDNAPLASWYRLGLPRDQAVKAQLMPDPAEIENDGGKIMLYPKGKGNSRGVRIKIPARPKVIKMPMEWSDGSKGALHYEAATLNNWKINGYGYRISDGGMYIVWKSASMRRGKLRDVPVEIYDTNANGNFNDYGQDTIVLGKGRDQTAHPLSKFQVIDGKMYEMKVEASGQLIRSRPYDGRIAALKVQYDSAVAPQALVAGGTGGDQNYYYNLMHAAEKPMWVVPGTHRYFHGVITDGRGVRAGALAIQADQSTRVKEVKVGERNIWELGASGGKFRADFEASVVRDGGKRVLRIPGNSVKIYGAGNEVYGFSSLGVWTPEIEVRRGKDGPIVIRSEFRRASQNDLSAKDMNEYSPRTLEEQMTFQGSYSVRIFGKYGPLGEIDSGWKTFDS